MWPTEFPRPLLSGCIEEVIADWSSPHMKLSPMLLTLAEHILTTDDVFRGAKASNAKFVDGYGKYISTSYIAADPIGKESGPVKLNVGLSVTAWNNRWMNNVIFNEYTNHSVKKTTYNKGQY